MNKCSAKQLRKSSKKRASSRRDPETAGSASYKVFCGNLGSDVDESTLAKAFAHLPTFQKAVVVLNRVTGKSAGYGFAHFGSPFDMLEAIKTVNNQYVGARPVVVKKSKNSVKLYETARR